MAAGIFMVLDDIAMLLDDAAMMSKVAAKKTAGVLGDDLAVGAEKASGFTASRELPVLWSITKGSLLNKLIILPIAFLLSAYAPWAIVPILMLGGLYLAYEGAEKIFEYFVPHEADEDNVVEEGSVQEREEKKIRSAIRTDFILSIEIIIIALGTVVDKGIGVQIIVVSAIALLATVGVYGVVALLVRMDDVGFGLIKMAKDEHSVLHKIGEVLVAALPKVIRLLTVIGTLAMLLVAGGIYVHNIHQIHEALHFLPILVTELLVGFIVGMIVLVVEKLFVKGKSFLAKAEA